MQPDRLVQGLICGIRVNTGQVPRYHRFLQRRESCFVHYRLPSTRVPDSLINGKPNAASGWLALNQFFPRDLDTGLRPILEQLFNSCGPTVVPTVTRRPPVGSDGSLQALFSSPRRRHGPGRQGVSEEPESGDARGASITPIVRPLTSMAAHDCSRAIERSLHDTHPARALAVCFGCARPPSTRGPAPGFTLEDQSGHEVSLDTFRGRRALMYFYP